MTTQTITAPPKDPLEALMNEDGAIARVDHSSVAVFARSETEAQLDAAHKYPRAIGHFLKEAQTLATVSVAVAESCMYALPRAGKTISGPSIRLAEICASAYGNLHVAARILDAEEREVIAQGVAWDLEKNIRVTTEVRRRITNKKGQRYDDDMITMTGNAAASIAIRNAIFRVVPRAYIDRIYEAAKKVAVGDAKTLAAKREDLVARLMKIGVPRERIFPAVGVTSIEDIGLEEVEVLIGLGTAIANGDRSIDDAFPPLAAEGASAAKKLDADLKAAAPAPAPTPEPVKHATAPTPTPEPAKHDADGVVAKPAEERDPALPDFLKKPPSAAEQAAAASVARSRAQAERKEREPGEEG